MGDLNYDLVGKSSMDDGLYCQEYMSVGKGKSSPIVRSKMRSG